MKQNQSSQSAAGVAMFRAIETEKPAGIRICSDPLAHALVGSGFSYALLKGFVISGLYDRLAPGATAFIAMRERTIDDFLIAALADGLEQVVILGAGFDTRAYRIPGIEKTRVFEIDHPATQQVKLEKLKKVVNPLPGNVTFIPVDFNTQTLEQSLLASSYNPQAKTTFLWQGVTYFLTKEGVDTTLAFIATHSGPGSSVIFDYFYEEVLLNGTSGYGKALRRAAKMSGEEYMFGIPQGQTTAFLTQRGFRDVQDRSLADLKRLYFTGPNANRIVPDGIAIASATVSKA
jgi:methyltransferase (TIGR00027 family)